MSDERAFLDSNVLVYLFDEDHPEKQSQAWNLVGEPGRHIVLSVQVLGEFFHVVTRKLRRPLSPSQALQATEHLGRHEVRPIDTALVRKAIRRRISSQLSYWDALIVETARDALADVLLTEDLNHGQRFGTLEVRNPFRKAD